MVPTASAPARPSNLWLHRIGRLLRIGVSLGLTALCVGGVVFVGLATDWGVPRLSKLTGDDEPAVKDWCAEHGVPEVSCVECKPDLLPRPAPQGWCAAHGVFECPIEHPEVAHTATPTPSDGARERAERALAYAPRSENNSACKLHERRIQFPSREAFERLTIGLAPATLGPVSEGVVAPGEVSYDPVRVARVGPRAAGVVWRADRWTGDRVRRGDVVALVDAADIGHAKAEFIQAIVAEDLKTKMRDSLASSPGTILRKDVEAAEGAVAEAHVRLALAEQGLLNLGLAVPPAYRAIPVGDLAAKIQYLGIPQSLVGDVAAHTRSSNLLPVTAPFDGVIISRSTGPGETADPKGVLYTIADTSTVWLTANTRPEDADRVKMGQPVRFRQQGRPDIWTGTVAWVSPVVDPATRTVPVRVSLPNPDGQLKAKTYGTAEIIQRDEPHALLVPSAAVHSEGDCRVVFVRDRNFESSEYKVFHVRTVRVGAKTETQTEIAAGLLPGEVVATTGSGVLRAELLRATIHADEELTTKR
ncbi:putative Co/Zn/Cd efflux system membrane fusion protein [Fimbriiglobus ruber]|uniref:Putative Co/Zn/Cd efflux system membrane fusion protein n=2 Tax=Fimbriiglobus ruber TaxID=1908690 RepID=A0A225DFE8_9BACT|nr:putative Co/Zn/Cd efflux system membrane fusion protein [Fimbriiglobus ruber]